MVIVEKEGLRENNIRSRSPIFVHCISEFASRLNFRVLTNPIVSLSGIASHVTQEGSKWRTHLKNKTGMQQIGIRSSRKNMKA
jgi:alanine racemase